MHRRYRRQHGDPEQCDGPASVYSDMEFKDSVEFMQFFSVFRNQLMSITKAASGIAVGERVCICVRFRCCNGSTVVECATAWRCGRGAVRMAQ